MAVSLAETTAPGLRLARELLAAEEAFAPLGCDVVVADSRPLTAWPDPWEGLSPAEILAPGRNRKAEAAYAAAGTLRREHWDAAAAGHPREAELRGVLWGLGNSVAVQPGICVVPPSVAGPPLVLLNRAMPVLVPPPAGGPVTHSRSLARGRAGQAAAMLAHELGHLRLLRAVLGPGPVRRLAEVEWCPLACRLAGLLLPTARCSRERPEEHFAEAYALWHLGQADADHAVLVEEVRECVREGRTWEP